jgi:hypothetical protein
VSLVSFIPSLRVRDMETKNVPLECADTNSPNSPVVRNLLKSIGQCGEFCRLHWVKIMSKNHRDSRLTPQGNSGARSSESQG